MEMTEGLQIDLFAENLPTIEEIKQLSNLVNSSEANQAIFREQVEENINSTSSKKLLAVGIGLYILGNNDQAIEKLAKAADCKEKYIYLAAAQRRIKQFDNAIENLDKSLKHDADKANIALEKAVTYRHAQNYDAAVKELKSCENLKGVNADYHYQLARLQEAQGEYDKALENYKTALELCPNHQLVLFHLAYRCDLSGQEDEAISYYRQIASTNPVHVSALMNLTILYEDAGKFDKAANCIEKILEAHPNHKKAILFKKDIESSKTMYFDEEKEKKKDRKNQILETPISDFELSVRSRNCLKKMKLNTIGDLLKVTEPELLSYKNFGETSLREIKAILESKNLRLGMNLEEKQSMHDFQDDSFPVEQVQDEGLLGKFVDDLNLSVRARNCLQLLNMRTIGELVQKTEAELLGCKNFGVTSLNEIKKALSNLGLSLRRLE